MESSLAIKSFCWDMHNANLIAANSIVKSFLGTVVIIIIIKAVLIKTTFLVVKTFLFQIILRESYSAYTQLAT